MNSRKIRSGKYGEYKGKLYKILPGDGSSDQETIKLCSSDEQDLENGFTNHFDKSASELWGFSCIKAVPKSEITKLCNITPRIVYKGIQFTAIGGRGGTNFVTLCSNFIRSCNPGEKEQEYEKELIKIGFHKGIVDKTIYMYIKEVPLDDPELEVFEIRQKVT